MLSEFDNLLKARAFQPKEKEIINLGLERMHAAINALGLQEVSKKTIIVAGTNGKGAVAGGLWRLLSLSGCSVGLFSSPHLLKFQERIQCSNVQVGERELVDLFRKIQLCLKASLFISLTYFEIATLLALLSFKLHKTEVNILEVGLGGRLDAVNAVNPIFTALSSIGLDHRNILGNTIAQIAKEKLGVIRKGKNFFCGNIDSKYRGSFDKILDTTIADKQGLLVRYGKDFYNKKNIILINLSAVKIKVSFVEHSFLKSQVSRDNFSLSVVIFVYYLYYIKKISRIKSLQAVVSSAVDQFLSGSDCNYPNTFIGRYQELMVSHLNGNKKFILDVCHNVDSIRLLHKRLLVHGVIDKNTKTIPGCVSIYTDKDINACILELKKFIAPLYLFKTSSHRCFKDCDIADDGVEIYNDFDMLWKKLLKCDSSFKSPMLVCGSFSAVAAVLNYFRVSPYGKEKIMQLSACCPSFNFKLESS
jgi:folylpolyglutamate synthase/dihydrofolate synthase